MTTTWDFGPETATVQAAIEDLRATRRTDILAGIDFILDQTATETWGAKTAWGKRNARNAGKVEQAARKARRLKKAMQNPLDCLNGTTRRSVYNPVTGELAPALSALACRDLLTRAVYDEQTIVWRAFIGPMHPEDPDWGFTKTERLMLRRALEADPMGSLKGALATVSEVTK